MPRFAIGLAALAVPFLLLAVPPVASAKRAAAADAPVVFFKDARKTPRRHTYGFLPGYRPPEVIERQRQRSYWTQGPYFWGPAWPGFFHNRWNGGGLGPCYTYTPIGYIWNCGM